ncbi:MAG TPA: hypothetical protein VGK59_11250 [Ohtaekwangia sp.]
MAYYTEENGNEFSAGDTKALQLPDFLGKITKDIACYIESNFTTGNDKFFNLNISCMRFGGFIICIDFI